MIIKNIKTLTATEKSKLFNRFGENFIDVMINNVVPIINDVRSNGDIAVKRYAKKFDNAELSNITATHEEIFSGYTNTSQELIKSFEKSISNIREFHSLQKREGYEIKRGNGSVLGTFYHPIDNAGIYVPGGKAAYPSSVMMGVIPAQIAGVKNITLITPCRNDAKLNDAICAICYILKINTIIKAGGAHGISAAALGTETIKKSDIIIGPGNIYVTAAKSYLFSIGAVQIDSLAGPSDVMIIDDGSTDPKWLAYDLLSQSEHDEYAAIVLITISAESAELVSKEIQKDLSLKIGRFGIKEKSVENNCSILIADSIDEAIDFSNCYAPEHLEITAENPDKYLDKIKNVGSLFLGKYSPVAAGDYYSGTNHILPTGGTARFASGVSVDTFMRRTTYQNLSRRELESSMKPIQNISTAEGFEDKHYGSVKIRFE